MSTTTQTNVRRGFSCKCFHCGESGSIRLTLDDVTGAEYPMSCGNCDSEFTLDDIRQHINGWQKALTWLESAPEFVEE